MFDSCHQLPIVTVLEQLPSSDIVSVAWGRGVRGGQGVQVGHGQDMRELLVLDAQGCLTGVLVDCALGGRGGAGRRELPISGRGAQAVVVVRTVAEMAAVAAWGASGAVVADTHGRVRTM